MKLNVLNWLRGVSIRTQLVLFAVTSCLVAATICCCSLMWSDWRLVHELKQSEVESLAEMLAFNSGAVITFMQHDSADELLSALDSQPTIEMAALYSSDGMLIGTYRSDETQAVPGFDDLRTGTVLNESGVFECVQTVTDAGMDVGLLVLHSNTDDVMSSLRGMLNVMLMVLFTSLVVSTLVAVGLVRLITRPILTLTDAAESVRRDENYSIRVQASTDNEIGELYSTFNGMLDRVEQSKQELRDINDHLEERVHLRTLELEDEIERREQTHKELLEAIDAAEAANRSKSQFLANMSHEIRTPMNAILGFTDLLRRHPIDGDPEERDDYLQTIFSSGQHLLTLINDILDLSKVEAGQLVTEEIPYSPHQIIAEVISVMRVPALEKGLSLNYHWNSPIPRQIQTDPSRLRQLLMNLIGNAVKFTHEGAVTVTARLENRGGESAIIIDVVDTGIGIECSKLEEVFDPFAQADTSVTRQFGGTGLGLTISRRLARQLGGDLTVKSEKGSGSVFTVVVSTGDLSSVEILNVPPAADVVNVGIDQLSETPPALAPSHILVVEDGETNRKLIKLMLERAGHQVSLAENGRIGVERAVKEEFDLILMDMQMPVLDGYGAATELKSKGYDKPIIALTAHAMKGDREDCIAAGCTDYLTKPVNEVDLCWKLSEYLPTACEGDEIESLTQDRSASTPNATLPSGSADDALLSSLPWDDEDYREIIEEFIEIAHVKTEDACQMFSEGDWSGLQAFAHWMRGTAGTAGFDQFSIATQKLEAAAEKGDPQVIAEMFERVCELVTRLQSQPAEKV